MPWSPKAEAAAEEAEAGNAVIEFVFLAVMLMIPTAFTLMAVSHAQAGAYAAVAGGQQALQVVEDHGLERVSAEQAQAAAAYAVADYGYSPDQVETRLSCTGDCTSGATLRIDVTVHVDVPLTGGVLSGGVMDMHASMAAWGGKYE